MLELLGTATSQGIPVIACTCPVCTSPDPRDHRLRASARLRHGGRNFIIDAGPDFRRQMLRARVPHVDGILITHEHNDHTAGLDDVRPFCFRQEMEIPVYCLPRVAADLRARYAYAFSDYPGVPRLAIREVDFGDTIDFAGTSIELLEVDHGGLPILGVKWQDIAYLTDVKHLPARTQEQCRDIGAMVISALHREGTHSHLSLEEAIDYVVACGAKRGVLTHFSHRMGKTSAVNAELPAHLQMGYDGLRLRVERLQTRPSRTCPSK